MSHKKVRPNIGDVFQIPIDENECGYGQILAKYKVEMLLMVIFEFREKCGANPTLADITASQPLFISNSLDAKLWHGHWLIIGNMSIDQHRFPLPNYKVIIGNNICVENYYADRARPATSSELSKLMFRKCVAPIRLENALKAHYGICDWNDTFDALKAEFVLQSSNIEI